KSDTTKSLEELKDLLAREGPFLAAVVLEPSVQGVAGMQQQPPGFLLEVAKLCKEAEVHLILDEVFVAFGRLGSMIVCGAENVQPDFLCLAKGLTGGYLPLAATITTNEIQAAFSGDFHDHRAFYHGHTFTANPLASAVALRNIELLENDLSNGIVTEGVHAFGRSVKKSFSDCSFIREVRQRGLAGCVDLCPNGDVTDDFPVERRVGLEVCLEARKRGVLLRPLGNSIPLIPPILVQPDESEFLCVTVRDAVDFILKKEPDS
ncbi:MAG: aminotransferase class III-fold pyridoxal phosphate-dependent enzyme, partial [Opitutales bacterium]